MKAAEFSIPESLDSDIQSTVSAHASEFRTRATIGNRNVDFEALKYSSANKWEIAFTESRPGRKYVSKTGSGSELQVFSFVIASIKEFIARYAPESVEFSSHKDDGNRTSLYNRIINRIKIDGYHLQDVESGTYDDRFIIVRDDK
jgi:hypothetical protein